MREIVLEAKTSNVEEPGFGCEDVFGYLMKFTTPRRIQVFFCILSQYSVELFSSGFFSSKSSMILSSPSLFININVRLR